LKISHINPIHSPAQPGTYVRPTDIPRPRFGSSSRTMFPAAAALFERVYPQHRWDSPNECEAYFREMLFNNPWCDPELPSWVAEEDGRITGFQIVMPRPMRFGGHPIRVAVSWPVRGGPGQASQPHGTATGAACMSGPQDLTLADGASDRARRHMDRNRWRGTAALQPALDPAAASGRLRALASSATSGSLRRLTLPARPLGRAGRRHRGPDGPQQVFSWKGPSWRRMRSTRPRC